MVGCVEILYDDERVGILAGCLDECLLDNGGPYFSGFSLLYLLLRLLVCYGC